jgi:hypothetical protein
MSRRNNDKGRLGPFVPVLKETLDCAAWKAMSHGARSLYIAIKRRYSNNTHNNGRLYLSQRDAAEEIGSHTNQIGRWFRELQHFGFIVMTSAGCLGVDGDGIAPHWRLTELGHMKEPPTRDFLRWDGKAFRDRAPTPPKRHKKQNPVLENADGVSAKTSTPLYAKTRTMLQPSVRENADIVEGVSVLEKQDILSIPLGGAEDAVRGPDQVSRAQFEEKLCETPTDNGGGRVCGASWSSYAKRKSMS